MSSQGILIPYATRGCDTVPKGNYRNSAAQLLSLVDVNLPLNMTSPAGMSTIGKSVQIGGFESGPNVRLSFFHLKVCGHQIAPRKEFQRCDGFVGLRRVLSGYTGCTPVRHQFTSSASCSRPKAPRPLKLVKLCIRTSSQNQLDLVTVARPHNTSRAPVQKQCIIRRL